MKLIWILVAFAGVFSITGCGNDSKQDTSKKAKTSYEKTVETLLQKEQKNPQLFLKVTGKRKKNVIGQTVVKGKITNGAKIATYKDVTVRIDFYSSTGTLLETDRETVYVKIGPGKSKDFKAKYFAPKGTKNAKYSIYKADFVTEKSDE